MTMFIRGEITVVFTEVWRINKKGRCFQDGKPISPNRRCDNIDEIKIKGGNILWGVLLIWRISLKSRIAVKSRILLAETARHTAPY